MTEGRRLHNKFFQASVKVVLAILALFLLGLPVLELWKMILLLVGWIALVCSDLRLERRRIYAAIAVVIFVVLVKSLLPVAAIEEGNNIFLYNGVEDTVHKGLPPEILKEWRQAFESHYPAGQFPDEPWRKITTATLYASSSDALWRPARYSRKVDTISFKNLSEFRGGFANDTAYNFVGGDPVSIARNFQAQLPFFVMYEFSKQSAGSTLYWHGIVHWQKADGSFEKIVHGDDAGRLITADDVGKRVYALNLPAVIAGGYKEWVQMRKAGHALTMSELTMRLKLSPKLMASRAAINVLSFLGVVALIGLMTRIKWRSYLTAMAYVAISLLIVVVYIHFSDGKFLGSQYPPHGGGDDGLSHESLGRDMARRLMTGDWYEALRGGQTVYWDTPGMRHARAVEKIIFGDTDLGYMALIILLPWFVYLFIHHLAGFKWAILGSSFFLVSPLGSLSFLQYIQNAKLGYAEAMAFGFFILGFYLFMRSMPRWGGSRDEVFAFAGGMSLAGSMFLRPNFAIAVVLLGLLYIIMSWRARSYRTMIAAVAGLAFALWMPLHNYLYGKKFVLISLAGQTISMPLSPLTYLQAGQELLAGNWTGEHITNVLNQLSGWLWTLPRLDAYPYLKVIAVSFMVVKWFTLAATFYIAFRPASLRKQESVLVLAWTALAAHMPVFFIFAPGQFRYLMMAWDLSAILTIIVIADHFRKTYGNTRLQSPVSHLQT